ncbi:MAG: nucleotidyltransferase family protein [Legionella sp.]|nr:nucleotidyltransferase family protein [Legionella sp.]
MRVAMILAAGRGERLKPLTDMIPKALCTVRGKPLIEHHVINLVRAGYKTIIINHAWLGGKIRQHLGDGARWGVTIMYSPEPPGGLETGGGIFNALTLLGPNPFTVVNADIFTDFDFNKLSLESITDVHLILVPKNKELNHHGDFGLNPGNLLSNFNPEYTFAGIACYHPNVFSHYQIGRYSLTPLLRQCAAQNRATASLHEGIWFDIGSKERLAAANLA